MSRLQTPAQALARYLPTGAPDECWEWQGTRSAAGYGVFSSGNRQHRAIRVAYELLKGPIPTGMLVRHTCDNPPCANPNHLLLGTPRDNMDDKVRRGRQTLGRDVPNSRLTEPDVLVIRRRYAAGESLASIARHFGMSHSQTTRVAKGIWWKHVEDVAS